MQAKRSRTVRSSSFGDTSLLNQVLPAPASDSPELRLNVRNSSENSAFARPSKFTAESDQHPSGILTLASADVEDESPEEHIGNFLEKCYYCKWGIAEGDEVFMCSYLRAFCTSKCRAKQITMDKLREKGFGQSVERLEMGLKVAR